MDRLVPGFDPSAAAEAVYLAARTLCPARGGVLAAESLYPPSVSSVGASLCGEVKPTPCRV